MTVSCLFLTIDTTVPESQEFLDGKHLFVNHIFAWLCMLIQTNLLVYTFAQKTTKKYHTLISDCLVSYQISETLCNLTVEYNDTQPAISPSHCATICYIYGCTVAHFTPHNIDSMEGTCRLFYEPVENEFACSPTKPELRHFATDKLVQLQCVRCSECKVEVFRV